MKDTNAPTWVFRSLPSSRCLLSTAWRQHIVFIMPVSSAGICLIARPGGNIGRKCCLEFCFVYLQSIMIFLLFLVIIIIFTSLRPSQKFLGLLGLHCLPSYFRPFMESKLKSSQRAAITRQIDHYKLMASSQLNIVTSDNNHPMTIHFSPLFSRLSYSPSLSKFSSGCQKLKISSCRLRKGRALLPDNFMNNTQTLLCHHHHPAAPPQTGPLQVTDSDVADASSLLCHKDTAQGK